jgi:hypothetical protein
MHAIHGSPLPPGELTVVSATGPLQDLRTGTSNLYRSAVAQGLVGLAIGSLTSSWKQYRLLPATSEDALIRRTRNGLSARLRSQTQSGKLRVATEVWLVSHSIHADAGAHMHGVPRRWSSGMHLSRWGCLHTMAG